MEKLIETVRSHPALFDKSNEDYMRTKLKDDLWENIATTLKYSNGKEVKEEWRKLRERHREALRRQHKRNGQESKSTCLWNYQKQMEFLKPYMKNGSTVKHPTTPKSEECSIKNENECSSAPNSINNEINQCDVTAGQIGNSDQIDNNTIKFHVTEAEPVARSMSEVGKKRAVDPVKIFMENREKKVKINDQQSQSQLQANLQNDAMYQFFMSMYNISKTFPIKQQRQVRRKVFEVIAEAEDDADTEEFT